MMQNPHRPFRRIALGVALLLVASSRTLAAVAPVEQPTAEQTHFFEAKIRPVLTERCYSCHSTRGDKIRGGLLLETRAGVLKGGELGPVIVPGEPDESLLIKAIRRTDPKLQMPPKEEHRLTPEQVADFEKWVAMGAPDPRVAPAGADAQHDNGPVFTAAERSWWAFQKVQSVAPPSVQNRQQVRNPIDAFIVSELQSKGLEPSPPADKITLLRRACLDLTGLPPTPAEVDAFLADESPDAFSKVVERLLASPHYGERWGRHWLDLARYAESDGFKDDALRPDAWRYRDYVIKSFNDDKPYDRFVKEQIAGDELWPHDPDARIATAFNRQYPEEWNARNLQQRRQETLNDITDTVGAVFTGLTFACARCHDHKYDPIRQVDYYRLQAFFANTSAADNVPLIEGDKVKEYEAKLAAWEEKTKDIRAEMAKIEEPKRQAAIKDYFDKYPPEIQAILKKPAEQRTPYERMMAARAGQYLDPSWWSFLARPEKLLEQLPRDKRERWEEMKARLDKFASLHPGPMPKAPSMADLSADAPPMFLLHRGNYDAPREEVQPGFLSLLDPGPAKVAPPAGGKSTGRRTALANILSDPNNPLVARVMVNRVWHYHFGRGIVGTPSDFGSKGEPPTHPQLLDWLAGEFVHPSTSSGQGAWSLKAIHRLIMNSRTYQQASTDRDTCASVDPDDKLMWRFPRQRLEAEVIRDAALSVAGLLSDKVFGPSVFPELPPGAPNRGGLWKVNDDPGERNRRSVYVFARRNNRYPLLDCFDAPDTLESCPRRNMTTTPLQALTMMNNGLVLKWAQAFAGRVLRETGQTADRDAWVTYAFRLAYGRRPDAGEAEAVKTFFDRHRQILQQQAAAGKKLAPPDPGGAVDALDGAVLVDLCHTLLNSNEFVYRN
jgi:hypothetical protein